MLLLLQSTRDLRGPGHSLAVRKGEIRTVEIPDNCGLTGAAFWTTDQAGRRFGLCRVGALHGWVVLEVLGRDAPGGPRAPSALSSSAWSTAQHASPQQAGAKASVAPKAGRPAARRAVGPALGPYSWEKEDESDDWDEWPI